MTQKKSSKIIFVERDINMIRQSGGQQIVGEHHANDTTKTQG